MTTIDKIKYIKSLDEMAGFRDQLFTDDRMTTAVRQALATREAEIGIKMRRGMKCG